MKSIKNYLRFKIIKWLYNTKAFEIKSWKSPTHYEAYSELKLFGESVGQLRWSSLEIVESLRKG